MIYNIRDVHDLEFTFVPPKEDKKYAYLTIKAIGNDNFENDGTLIPTFMDNIKIYEKKVYNNFGYNNIRLAVTPQFKELVELNLDDAESTITEAGYDVASFTNPFEKGLSIFAKITDSALTDYNEKFGDNDNMTAYIRVSIWYGVEKKNMGVNFEVRALKPLIEKKSARKCAPKKVLKENTTIQNLKAN